MRNKRKLCKLLNISRIDLYERFIIHPASELEKGATGVAGLESKGERPCDAPRASETVIVQFALVGKLTYLHRLFVFGSFVAVGR